MGPRRVSRKLSHGNRRNLPARQRPSTRNQTVRALNHHHRRPQVAVLRQLPPRRRPCRHAITKKLPDAGEGCFMVEEKRCFRKKSGLEATDRWWPRSELGSGKSHHVIVMLVVRRNSSAVHGRIIIVMGILRCWEMAQGDHQGIACVHDLDLMLVPVMMPRGGQRKQRCHLRHPRHGERDEAG